MKKSFLLSMILLLVVLVGCKPQDPAPAKGEETKTEKPADPEKPGDEAKPVEDKVDPSAKPAEQGATDKPAEPVADAPTEPAVVDPAAPAVPAELAALDVAAYAAGGTNPFLSMIPADAPYAWVSLKTVPFEEMPFDISKWMPFYEGLAEQLAKDVPSFGAGFKAVVGELKDKMTKEGLESLGVATQGHMAIYGVGVWPVLRMQLKDGAAFEAFVQRIETAIGAKAELKKLGDVPYRVFPIEDGIVLTAVVLPNQVVLALAPEAQLEWLFGYVFGQTKLDKSMADSGVFETIMTAHASAKGLSAGMVDLLGIEKVLSGDATNLVSESLVAMGAPLPLLAGDCKTEVDALAAKFPRLMVIAQEFEGYADMALTLQVTDATLLSELQGLRAAVPGMGATIDASNLAALGLAVDLKAGLDWLTAKGAALQESPFKCEFLAGMNEAGGELSGLGAQVPPPFMSLKGAFVLLKDIAIEGGMPSKLEVMALVAGSGEELWKTVSGMAPEFAGQQTELGKVVPVTVLPPQMPPFIQEPSLLVADNAIAVSVGAGLAEQLPAFASAASGENAPLMLMAFDYGRLMTLVSALPDADPMMAQMGQYFGGFGMTTMRVGVSETGVEFGFQMQYKK
ncbi:MAG: hypothetical protein RBU37_00915 [Myxococcota bacterium]|jgi:hypothetical protein|nr:hypothetical protein [Myxococcota bacterium]